MSTLLQSEERENDGAFSPKDHHHTFGEDHDNAFDHEAILGSRKDAEEFDELSPEEAKKRLKVLLGKMDRNKDAQIDRYYRIIIVYLNCIFFLLRNELYSWILRSFKSLSEEDSNDRFDDSDEDEDGFVTWEEYKAEEYDFGDGDIDLSDPDMAEEWKLMEEDKFLFLAADKNQDDKLDQKEFLSFSHPEEDQSMRPHVLSQVN